MPYKSEKQRRYLHMFEPEIAARWDAEYGTKVEKKSSSKKPMAKKKQGYNDRLDDSMGARNGKKSQTEKDRRDESEAMEKKAGKPKFSGNKSSNQGKKKKKKTGKKNLTATLAARQKAGK